MRRLALALAALSSACAAPVRPATAAPGRTPVATNAVVAKNMSPGTGEPKAKPRAPAPTSEQALAAVHATVERAELTSYGGPPLAERARAAKLDETALLGLLDDLVAACPTDKSCPELQTDSGLRRLLDTLAAVGSVASAPTLLRLDARGVWSAGWALEQVLAQATADAVPRARCVPPDAAEVAAARAALADFLIVHTRGGQAVARAPAPAELDDLAYFFAAVADNGAEVGAAVEGTRGSAIASGTVDPERDRLAAAVTAARQAGDIAGIARDGEAYLQRLGYPGPLDGAAEDNWAWGGARFSYVLRDVALARELLGEHAQAGELYRRAEPGGGMCGTSVSTRWTEQVRGAIRSAERSGDCRTAIAERLLDIDGPIDIWSRAPDATDYGPARLARAGFDVPRLVRGALATANRELEPKALRAAIERAPQPLRGPALARLEARGPEAWERRIQGVEGLADLEGRAALPVLVGLLPGATPLLRPRVLQAIGALGARPFTDPCDPDIHGGEMRGKSGWQRHVTPLGERCETSLRLHEARRLALSLAPWLKDPVPETREAAALAIGAIGHRAALPALRERASDPHRTGTICRENVCKPHYPVREAAAEAIAHIKARSRSDADWPKHDPS